MANVTITPVWTNSITVVASVTMAKAGTTVRGTIDLTTKFGAYLFPRLGRKGATALTNGVNVLVRRLIGTTGTHVGPVWSDRSQSVTAVTTTVDVDAAAGTYALDTASGTGLLAGDIVIVGANTAREEFLRVSKVATNILTFDTALQFAHTAAQADPVTNKADVWSPVWVDGGAVVEVVFDYGDDAAGSDVQVSCFAQSYNSNLAS